MSVIFYLSGLIAVIATVMVITRVNVVHALLYFIVSLLAVAAVFFTLGAPFAAMLELIVYAGAIMVLFLIVMMMLNLGKSTQDQEKAWLRPAIWLGPVILAIPLLLEMLWVISTVEADMATRVVTAKEVGVQLFGPYLI